MMNEMALLLSDDVLDFVVGGDYGDSDRERHSGQPMYQVKQEIEVYDNELHITTEHATIIDMWKTEKGYYEYKVKFRDVKGHPIQIVKADDIER